MKKHYIFLFIYFVFINFLFAVPKVEKATKPAWVLHPKEEGKNVSLKSVKEGYFYRLIDNQVNVETESDYAHFVLDIVSKVGVQQASNISVTFMPAYQKLTFHEMLVWRNGEVIDKLKTNEIKVIQSESDLSSFLYHGSYYAHIILDDIREGDRIEYAYTVQGRNPVFKGKYSQNLFFDDSVPIAQLYKRLIVGKDRVMQIRNFGQVPAVHKTVDNTYQYYEWKGVNIKAVELEDNIPGWKSIYSRVEVSEYKDWREIADWANALNLVKEIREGVLGEKIKFFKDKHPGYHKEGFIKEVIGFVQDEIRYMGVEIGVYSHKANSPEKVYKQRYGDCKDKSVLLASILRSGGIDAKVALVNSYRGSVLEESLVSPLLFDHMIVYINHKGRSYFIDPTISYQRGGLYKLYCPKYYKALILSDGQNKLTDIPQQPVELGKIKVEESFFVSPQGDTSSLVVRTVYSGNHANDMRYRIAYAGEDDMSKEFLTYYQKIYQGVEIAKPLKVRDNEYENILEIEESYDIKNLWTLQDNNKPHFYFNAGIISSYLTQLTGNRKLPLALSYPLDIEYNAYFHMWSPWNVKKANYEVKRDAYEFSYETKLNQNIVSISYRLKTLKDHIAVEKLDEYGKDRTEMDKTFGLELFYSAGGMSGGQSLLLWGKVILAWVAVVLAVLLAYLIYKKPSGYTISYKEYFTLQTQSLGWYGILFVLIILWSFIQFLGLLYNVFGEVDGLEYSEWEFVAVLTVLFNLIWILVNVVNIVLGVLVLTLLGSRRVETIKYANIWLLLNLACLLLFWVYKEWQEGQVSAELRVFVFLMLAIFMTIWYFFKTAESKDLIFRVPYPYPNRSWLNVPLKSASVEEDKGTDALPENE
ncbi:DUF3857 domain-containing transglutaminase family protein [Pseudopedobacter beijingensis]|uniref:DUF3857 domain-containing transglutaminase family protein n=1 Tax=Pseudopedobacter beijingensis TaxID=1207056 RepID=A0ABW4IGG9_9SPHI